MKRTKCKFGPEKRGWGLNVEAGDIAKKSTE